MDNNLFDKENLNIWIGPLFTFILTIILLLQNVYLGIIGVAFTFVLAFIAWEKYNNKRNEFKEFVDKLDITFDGFSKKALFDMPFSIIILDRKNDIVWYNGKLKNMVSRKESLVDKKVDEILPGIDKKFKSKEENEVFEYEFEQRNYEVRSSVLEKEQLRMLYFIDSTEKIDIERKYNNEKLVVMNIRLDNIEELNQNVSSEKRPILYAEIDSEITSYFHKYDAFLKKNENGKYFAITDSKSLKSMVEDKFSFIEKVRNISSGNTIPPTLSIGIGYEENTPRQNEKSSNAALDMALARGGDQVAIKTNEKMEYFGGKTQATEKRTKVRARVIAQALNQLIEKSTEVIISGHTNPDMDSFGSAVGIWHAATQKGKKAYIVLNDVSAAIKNIYEYTTVQQKGLREAIIDSEEALNIAKSSTLFIITDNHRKSSLEVPELLEKTNQVVIIDHHRRGNDYIENPTLGYIETSSSSASELVTEMLMYMDEKLKIDKIVSEALLAGITVDTKNFTQQTGARTFEAATILKQSGANTSIVNKLFMEDFDTLKQKSEIISQSEVYKEHFIIGIFDSDSDSSTLIASQAANDLVALSGIEASFVLTRKDGRTHISARSNEKISVQLIMEKLGGGGHLNMAATQLDMSIEESKELLKKAISEYLKENNEE